MLRSCRQHSGISEVYRVGLRRIRGRLDITPVATPMLITNWPQLRGSEVLVRGHVGLAPSRPYWPTGPTFADLTRYFVHKICISHVIRFTAVVSGPLGSDSGNPLVGHTGIELHGAR